MCHFPIIMIFQAETLTKPLLRFRWSQTHSVVGGHLSLESSIYVADPRYCVPKGIGGNNVFAVTAIAWCRRRFTLLIITTGIYIFQRLILMNNLNVLLLDGRK